MKRLHLLGLILVLSLPLSSIAQGVVVLRGAAQLVKILVDRGGTKAASEISTLGGEKIVQEVFDKAAKEGGEQLAGKLERYSLEFGPSVLRGAKESPSKFVAALETLPESLRAGAIQGVSREPELMATLTQKYGSIALESAAKHPGVGPTVLRKLGAESSEFLGSQSTDQIVRVARLSDGIAMAPPVERKALLAMIRQAPEKTLNLLEINPNVLKTAAVLTAFLASKDQILGATDVVIGPDGRPVVLRKPGIVEKLSEAALGLFEKPLTIVAFFFGIALIVASLLYLKQGRRA